jgi:nucleotidyltransferase-like protein
MELGRPLATVTPTLDGDVLAVLAMNDIVFTTGQLHRVLGHHSEEGIRKVLRRLTGQGIVLSDKVGQAFAYRLNRDHLAAGHVIGLARLLETFLARLETHLESWEIPAVYAAVFGSAAKGTMTVDSDLDLLLVRPDGADDERWQAQVDLLVVEVTRWTGNDTRPLEFTAGEIAARGRGERVLLDVLEEGLTVAGTHAWLAKQLRRNKD